MAKRRRLTPFDPEADPPPATLRSRGPEAPFRARAPVAEVAGEASARAALDTLAGEMAAARAEGRIVERIPLERIASDHLIRDRMEAGEEDMEALVESLRARGQQVPAEVVALSLGRYGLISGWRRLRALERLHKETGEARFSMLAAIVRVPDGAAGAYLAMVEENEIRAPVSFYERARLAAEAARIGIHPTLPAAIAALYARASAPRRSKIASFAILHAALGDVLRFGPAIPERLGLALAAALQGDADFAPRLRDALVRAEAREAEAERAVLEQALRAGAAAKVPRAVARAVGGAAKDASRGEEVAPGLFLRVRAGQAILSGPGLDAAALTALRSWAAGRG